jgi:hypothetical protein
LLSGDYNSSGDEKMVVQSNVQDLVLVIVLKQQTMGVWFLAQAFGSAIYD